MWRTKASLVSLGHLCHIRNENTNRNLLIACPFNSIERKREREKIKHAGTANAHMPRRIGPIGPVPNAAAFGKQWITSQAILSQQKKKKESIGFIMLYIINAHYEHVSAIIAREGRQCVTTATAYTDATVLFLHARQCSRTWYWLRHSGLCQSARDPFEGTCTQTYVMLENLIANNNNNRKKNRRQGWEFTIMKQVERLKPDDFLGAQPLTWNFSIVIVTDCRYSASTCYWLIVLVVVVFSFFFCYFYSFLRCNELLITR